MSETNPPQETSVANTPSESGGDEAASSGDRNASVADTTADPNTAAVPPTQNPNVASVASDAIISDRLAAALANATRDGVATAITNAIRTARENSTSAGAQASTPTNTPATNGSTTASPQSTTTANAPAPTNPTSRNVVSHSHVHHHGHQIPVPNNQGSTAARSIRRPHVSVERNAQGARVARVDIGRGNVVTVPLNRNDNAVNVRVVQIDPLLPSPINDNGSNQATDNDETLQRFKCEICYEFMKEPVGCGNSSCSSRFCRTCLQRVAIEAASRPPNNGNNTDNNTPSPSPPKCPTCRVEFRTIVIDQALKIEIHNGPTVPCRFEGCTQQLKLPLVGDHEKVCEHVLMKCRYASFGCKWTGKRGLIAAHEKDDCGIAKISGFVEDYRRLRGDHQSRLEMLQQQVVGTIRMNNVHRQNLQRDQLKSPQNLFDLMQYCHAIMCTTPFFMFTREKWVSLFRSNEARASVINFLVFLPTIVTCISTASNGYSIAFDLMDQKVDNPTLQTIAIEEALICICIGALGVLIIVGNFVDSKSSIRWGRFPIRHMEKPPVMCDLLAVAVFTIHLSIMEYHGADVKSLMLWWCLAVSSTFIPALVAAMSHVAARNMTSAAPPTSTNLITLARSFEPFLFGLRLSALATFVGMGPCFDAPLLVSIIPKTTQSKICKHFSMTNCFFEAVERKFVFAYVGIKAAKVCSGVEQYEDIPQELLWWLLESGFAVVLLLLLTIFLGCLFEIGIKTGNRIATQSAAEVRPEGVQKDYNLMGMFCYGGWMSLLCLLTQFR